MLGYFLMGIIFLILRFFYHILPKKKSHENIIWAIKKDLRNLFVYTKLIILSNPKLIKTILAIIVILFILPVIPYNLDILYAIYSVLSTVMYFLLAIVFTPREHSSDKGFPVEIFGFTYSVIFMFYSAGSLIVDVFYMNDFFKEDIWIYGYCITIISYVVCIATLKGFMERNLSNEEIVLLGMIMMTTLEFITYYGIGFFCNMENYNPSEYEKNLFGAITKIVNKGIYVASQSQILERNDMEVWGNIILNGTDVLTITAVLGYVMQKFLDK